jgi:hypothetical protein
MAKNTKKIGYKGPRVSAKIVQMDEAGRKEWLAGLTVTDAERKAIADRLEKAVKEGVKPRKMDLEGFKASLASQPIEALVEIQVTIAPLIENGKVAAAAKIKEQIAKLEEQARLMGIEA